MKFRTAKFDMSVLRTVLKWYELPIPKLHYFCTCSLARYAWPGLESYALTDLAKKFGVVYNAHNALEDAMTCGKLVQIASEKFGHGKTFTELLEGAGIGMKIL